MSETADQEQTQLQKNFLNSIGAVSSILRNAIAKALPVAPEQYMTIAIPGTVIDLAEYDQGGSFVYDVKKHATTPTTVRQSEAQLVDGMIPIASIMIGNTGKSVARSYSRSLDALVPKQADFSGVGAIRSPGSEEYKQAMADLKKPLAGSNKTIVDVYREKQIAWTEERSRWDRDKIETSKRAEALYPPDSGPDYIGKQKQYINDWNQENYFSYKASVQAAWMDWVVNGDKYDVEFKFGVIDIDSIMSRINSSKESLRNSIIPDADGSGEVYGVSLTPKSWASMCRDKAIRWHKKNGNFTLAQVESEITRLESLLESYNSADTLIKPGANNARAYPVKDAVKPDIDPEVTKQEVVKARSALYEAQAALTGAKYNFGLQLGEITQGNVDEKQKDLVAAQKRLRDAEDADQLARRNMNEYDRMVLSSTALADAQNWITKKKETIEAELAKLRIVRAGKAKDNPVEIPVILGVPNEAAQERGGDEDAAKVPSGMELAVEGSEKANPIFTLQPPDSLPGTVADEPPKTEETTDPFTTITFSYSASELSTHQQESSWGMKVGGSVGFGLWSVGGSYAHDETKKSMQSDMATCDVSVSFSALVVNIGRPWLYGELFTDVDLEVAQGVRLSPGPMKLHQMIKNQNVDEIAGWSQFPAYPTSFIVAADTTIEFRGATKHIEEHFSSHSNSGGASVGYGPWSVSGSFHQSASSQSMQVHSTATGCKISFGAPQVIAWTSQILPALPRPQNYNPLTQGGGLPVTSG